LKAERNQRDGKVSPGHHIHRKPEQVTQGKSRTKDERKTNIIQWFASGQGGKTRNSASVPKLRGDKEQPFLLNLRLILESMVVPGSKACWSEMLDGQGYMPRKGTYKLPNAGERLSQTLTFIEG